MSENCNKCGMNVTAADKAMCSWCDEPGSELAASASSAEAAVITELSRLRIWIKKGTGYIRDDAPDEIARAIANRIRDIKSWGLGNPPNAEMSDGRTTKTQ